MITTGLLVLLLIVRSVTLATSGPRSPDRIPVINRMIGPVAVAFAALVLVRLVDLWIRNA